MKMNSPLPTSKKTSFHQENESIRKNDQEIEELKIEEEKTEDGKIEELKTEEEKTEDLKIEDGKTAEWKEGLTFKKEGILVQEESQGKEDLTEIQTHATTVKELATSL